MTHKLLAIVLLNFIMAGCSGSEVEYRCRASLVSAGEPGVYDVNFVIEDVSNPEAVVLSTPQLRLIKGKRGTFFIGDQQGGLTYTAIVYNISGNPEARTAVSIKKNGIVVWNDEQTVVMSE